MPSGWTMRKPEPPSLPGTRIEPKGPVSTAPCGTTMSTPLSAARVRMPSSWAGGTSSSTVKRGFGAPSGWFSSVWSMTGPRRSWIGGVSSGCVTFGSPYQTVLLPSDAPGWRRMVKEKSLVPVLSSA